MARISGSTGASFLIVVVLALAIGFAAWFLLRPETTPSPEAPAAAPARTAGDRLPPPEAKTQADVRKVRDFTDSATAGDVPELRKLALESKDALVAGNAIRALGRLQAVVDDAQLLALIDDDRERVRQELVTSLGLSGSPRAVRPLVAMIEKRDATLRPLAIQALGRLRVPEARAPLEAVVSDPKSTQTDVAFAREALKSE